MSVSIYWKPIDPNSGNFVGGNASLVDILRENFGMPAKIHPVDIGFLEGLVAAGYKDIEIVIKAVRQHPGGIVLTAEY